MDRQSQLPPPAAEYAPTPPGNAQLLADSLAAEVEVRYRRWRELAALVEEARRRAEALTRLSLALRQRR